MLYLRNPQFAEGLSLGGKTVKTAEQQWPFYHWLRRFFRDGDWLLNNNSLEKVLHCTKGG